MKSKHFTIYFIFLFALVVMPFQYMYGQDPGGYIRMEKCQTCGKLKQNCKFNGKHPKCQACGKLKEQCPYNGKHPKCQYKRCGKTIGASKNACPYNGNHPKCQTCKKIKEECPYKGNHPKCQTCGELKEDCPYNGNHPAPEAAGYDVTITCNVPTALLYIDGNQNGTASGTRFLKTGQHSIKLTATGYMDYTNSITVGADSRSFSFTMTKEESSVALPEVIQHLINNMVYIEGGTFTMGGSTLAHQVTLSSFSIGRYEVTQEEWETVMGTNPSSFKGARRPVECVSWDDCQEFIKKLNALTGKKFRLPTEAEWEFAARGGNKGKDSNHEFAGSNTVGAVAWYDDNSGNRTHEVGGKSPNELGLYDMSGNVWEWCNDWYDSGYYTISPSSNPKGPSSGSFRVSRGGCWGCHARYCRVSNRYSFTPTYRYFNFGLRLAL